MTEFATAGDGEGAGKCAAMRGTNSARSSNPKVFSPRDLEMESLVAEPKGTS